MEVTQMNRVIRRIVGLIVMIVLPRAAWAAQVSLTAGADVALSLDAATGNVNALTLDGRRLPRTAAFRIEDVARRSTVEPRGPAVTEGNLIKWTAQDRELDLRLNVTFAATRRALEVSGSLRDLSGADRCVKLMFVVKLRAEGWTW